MTQRSARDFLGGHPSEKCTAQPCSVTLPCTRAGLSGGSAVDRCVSTAAPGLVMRTAAGVGAPLPPPLENVPPHCAGASVRLIHAMGGNSAYGARGKLAGRLRSGGASAARVGCTATGMCDAAVSPCHQQQLRAAPSAHSLSTAHLAAHRRTVSEQAVPSPAVHSNIIRVAHGARHLHACAGTTSTNSSWTGSGGMTRQRLSCRIRWGTSTTGCLFGG